MLDKAKIIFTVSLVIPFYCELANDIYVFGYVKGESVQVKFFSNKKKGGLRLEIADLGCEISNFGLETG